MWRIIKTEFSYNKILYLVLFSFIPIICAVTMLPIEDLQPNFWLFLLMFTMTINWNKLKNKENRDLQYLRLPLSIRKIAIARILMIMISCLSLIIFYALIYYLFVHASLNVYKKWLISFEIILFGFSVYFILRDLFSGFFRKIGFTRNNIIVGLFLILLGLGLSGFYFLFITASTGEPPIQLKSVISFIKMNNPFNSEAGIAIFMAVSVVLAILTVVSYSRRKSYLE